eukprot:2588346-Rhodomonas_salina.1
MAGAAITFCCPSQPSPFTALLSHHLSLPFSAITLSDVPSESSLSHCDTLQVMTRGHTHTYTHLHTHATLRLDLARPRST